MWAVRLHIRCAVCWQRLMHYVARDGLPVSAAWLIFSFHCIGNDGLVLGTDLVESVVVSRRCEPAMLWRFSRIGQAIARHQLLPDLCFILQHLVVSAMRRKAAAVVLMQNLHLKTTRLESSKQVLA